MKIKQAAFLSASIFLILICCNSLAQSGAGKNPSADTDWTKYNGIVQPSHYGISLLYTHLGRNIRITDITAEHSGQDPETISDFSTSPVKNHSYITDVKLDTWLFPAVNFYILAGYATTEANLNAAFTIDQAPPLTPVEINIKDKTTINGPYIGIGTSVSGNYKNWFILADANYSETLPDKFNNTLSFTMLSVSTGIARNIGDYNQFKTWIGGFYADSNYSVEMTAHSDPLGDVLIKVNQHPENPWAIQLGFMFSFSQRFELATQLSTNFKDASISMVTASYRF